MSNAIKLFGLAIAVILSLTGIRSMYASQIPYPKTAPIRV